MKKLIYTIAVLGFVGILTACQSKPKVDLELPTNPPDPAAMRPAFGPND